MMSQYSISIVSRTEKKSWNTCIHDRSNHTTEMFPRQFLDDITNLSEGSILPVHLILALIVDVRRPGHYELRPRDLSVWG